MSNEGIAPIVLFVYARPGHTRQTIDALAANILAKESDLIIYSDAEKGEAEGVMVKMVRELIYNIEGFRSVKVVERESNYGLARNIIEGVTEVCNDYGRAIVLEDDIVTSPYFLSYMNAALDKYVEEKNIWHISGWNYPMDTEGLGDAFLWRVMNCWGWATWANRWQYFSKSPNFLVNNWGKDKINRFNLDGSCDLWSQVTANYKGRLDTWAIFWYATIFEHGGLCLNPSVSLVENIGNDGSGENCEESNIFKIGCLSEKISDFPPVEGECLLAIERVKYFYKKTQDTLISRMTRRLKKLIVD